MHHGKKNYQLQKASCDEQDLMTDIPSAIWTTFLIFVTTDKLLVPVTHKSAIITFFSLCLTLQEDVGLKNIQNNFEDP